jgi:hypothetical protein
MSKYLNLVNRNLNKFIIRYLNIKFIKDYQTRRLKAEGIVIYLFIIYMWIFNYNNEKSMQSLFEYPIHEQGKFF